MLTHGTVVQSINLDDPCAAKESTVLPQTGELYGGCGTNPIGFNYLEHIWYFLSVL